MSIRVQGPGQLAPPRRKMYRYLFGPTERSRRRSCCLPVRAMPFTPDSGKLHMELDSRFINRAAQAADADLKYHKYICLVLEHLVNESAISLTKGAFNLAKAADHIYSVAAAQKAVLQDVQSLREGLEEATIWGRLLDKEVSARDQRENIVFVPPLPSIESKEWVPRVLEDLGKEMGWSGHGRGMFHLHAQFHDRVQHWMSIMKSEMNGSPSLGDAFLGKARVREPGNRVDWRRERERRWREVAHCMKALLNLAPQGDSGSRRTIIQRTKSLEETAGAHAGETTRRPDERSGTGESHGLRCCTQFGNDAPGVPNEETLARSRRTLSRGVTPWLLPQTSYHHHDHDHTVSVTTSTSPSSRTTTMTTTTTTTTTTIACWNVEDRLVLGLGIAAKLNRRVVSTLEEVPWTSKGEGEAREARTGYFCMASYPEAPSPRSEALAPNDILDRHSSLSSSKNPAGYSSATNDSPGTSTPHRKISKDKPSPDPTLPCFFLSETLVLSLSSAVNSNTRTPTGYRIETRRPLYHLTQHERSFGRTPPTMLTRSRATSMTILGLGIAQERGCGLVQLRRVSRREPDGRPHGAELEARTRTRTKLPKESHDAGLAPYIRQPILVSSVEAPEMRQTMVAHRSKAPSLTQLKHQCTIKQYLCLPDEWMNLSPPCLESWALDLLLYFARGELVPDINHERRKWRTSGSGSRPGFSRPRYPPSSSISSSLSSVGQEELHMSPSVLGYSHPIPDLPPPHPEALEYRHLCYLLNFMTHAPPPSFRRRGKVSFASRFNQLEAGAGAVTLTLEVVEPLAEEGDPLAARAARRAGALSGHSAALAPDSGLSYPLVAVPQAR
ncbi:hypothetical protein FA13DRAFT_1717164 [Coprinellus micaceus]|uniref:Uncharacterized protein n=1 Tax=Coprinellus micaceus TaxID=71717 RepID=A0A4Y7SH50_COPMI|nr:hypothetical protein FA13DRAFT_1717164 [Coprinellus micaceus]